MFLGTKGVVVLAMMLLITGVAAPLLFDFTLTLLEGLGYRDIRRRKVVGTVAKYILRGSDTAEYVVMAATLGMILLPIYLHFQEFAPFWKATHPHHDGVWHMVVHHILPSLFINTNLLFHFFFASTKKPRSLAPSSIAAEDSKRYCRHCNLIKPPRAHHCSTCKRCVEKMDHHCPFTGNCVGPGNQHHFYLFITYGMVATVYAVYLSFHPYRECSYLLEHEGEGENSVSEFHDYCVEWHQMQIRLFYFSAGICIIVSSFWLFISFLLATDQTTIEFLQFSKRKVQMESIALYRERGLINNFQGVLGPWRFWWRWLLPIPALHRSIYTSTT
eukprot:m.81589 g.81589  ORF g.81589 m.81589 type:complete len:330 (+) comp12062_c0_seq2:52-1041(+)